MQILVDIFIPLLIILMMLVVGLELTPDDFRRVRQFSMIVLGQGREQGAEAFQQELHNAAMRPLLRLEYEQHCCAISGTYLWTTP